MTVSAAATNGQPEPDVPLECEHDLDTIEHHHPDPGPAEALAPVERGPLDWVVRDWALIVGATVLAVVAFVLLLAAMIVVVQTATAGGP